MAVWMLVNTGTRRPFDVYPGLVPTVTIRKVGQAADARFMRDACQLVVSQYHGHWPSRYEDLIQLPGFGPYTAAAVAVFASRQPISIRNVCFHKVAEECRDAICPFLFCKMT